MRTGERSLVRALIAGAVLIILLFIIFKISVRARGRFFGEDIYAAEAGLTAEVRDILRIEGIRNPGINVTSVTSDGSSYDYSILIHLPSYVHPGGEFIEQITDAIKGLRPDFGSIAEVRFS